jgi:phosphoribosylglycinamide formyltransferase-1
MTSLIEASKTPGFPAEIALVLSNRPDAAGLAFARARGIAAVAMDHRTHATREGFERAMQAALVEHRVDLVCLAGFMRLLTPWFVEQWRDRMLNIHPALLPSYKGLHTHERALADGVKIHGCTVHFVVPDMDAGPIVAQSAVPVLDDDTPDALAARVLAREHAIYPMALRLVASGEARVVDGRVVGGRKAGGSLTSPDDA